MQITCDRESLLQSFQLAASMAPKRSSTLVLDQVKLEVGDHATLIASDLEASCRIDVQGVEVKSPGAVLLPVQRFLSVLKEGTGEKIVITETDGKTLQIATQQGKFKLSTRDPAEYPLVSAFSGADYHQISVRLFRELLRRVEFCAGDSSRYANGILLEISGNQITGVAIDGRRLAAQSGPAEKVGDHDPQGTTVIPAGAARLMLKMLANCEGDVMVAIRDNDVVLRSGSVTFYSRLVDGRYPVWRKVFPERETTKIELVVRPFFSIVRQAAIVVADAETSGVDFAFGKGNATLSSFGAEAGESVIEMPITYEGTSVNAILNPKYVSDFLRVLDSEQTFQMQIDTPETPVVCRTEDGYSYVVMPQAEVKE